MINVIIWLPRALAIILTVLVFLMVADGAGQAEAWYLPLVASVPGLVLLITTLIAWRWAITGGVIFFALGLSYLYQAYMQGGLNEPAVVLIMVIVPLLIGILFVMQEMAKKRL
jgi:hypothetical protein